MAFIRGLDEDMTRSYVDVRFFLSGVYRRDVLYTKPLSICNGLIFYRSVRALSEPKFYICNPETKERVAVPKFNTKEIYYVISGLAFDPAIPNRNGCNVASYKLVVGSLKRQLRFKVYCSSTRAWREPSSSCYPEPRRYRRLQVYPPSIFYHGVLHWLVDVDCLLTFDPELEISRWVETPNGGDCKTTEGGYEQPARLVEWEGELYYIRSATTLRLDVWKMSDYSCCSSSARWVLLHSIEAFIPRVIEELHIPNWWGLFPLAVDNGGDRIMFCTHAGCMILYDLRSKRVAKPPFEHDARRKIGYDNGNGPSYLRYIPTLKFLTK